MVVGLGGVEGSTFHCAGHVYFILTLKPLNFPPIINGVLKQTLEQPHKK